MFASEPPFYRRLASLAQAALICRQIRRQRADSRRLLDWAFRVRGTYWCMQTLVDMRVEPRWSPDYAFAHQLKADFCGRVMLAGRVAESSLRSGDMRSIILGDDEYSLSQAIELPQQYFPGPLEGGRDCPNPLPDDVALIIENQLGADRIEAASFVALANSARIFDVPFRFADLAAECIKRCNYHLFDLKGESHLIHTLTGLAGVVAVTKSVALEREVLVLARRHRRDPAVCLPIVEALKVGLIASACREDPAEWRQSVGEWLTDLAFGDLDENDGEILYAYLSALLHLVPDLWASCARAEAALRAWRSR